MRFTTDSWVLFGCNYGVSSNPRRSNRVQRTKAPEAFPKPVQSHHYDSNVYKAKIRDDGCDVDEDLLVRLERFDVNATGHQRADDSIIDSGYVRVQTRFSLEIAVQN